MAKPKLALIPAAQGTKLYSVLPSNGTGDFTFTRGSKATRINAQGLIEIVNDNISRLDYPMIDGVQKGCPHHILEPARTNVVQYSEAFDNAYWTKTGSSITSNVAISPDGSLNADKLVEGTSLGLHQVQRNLGTISGNVTFSIYAKSSERNIIFINAYTGSSNRTFFDLSNGNVLTNALGSTAKIELLPNEYYRCSVERVANALVGFEVGVSQADGVISYQGDGTSGAYIFGAMLEQGSYPTSYIPTNGESGGVTRSAETANGAGNSTTFNDSEGVLMAEFSSDDINVGWIGLGSGSSNRILLGTSGGNVRSYNNIGGTVINYQSTINSNSNNKIAIKYKSGDTDIYINGFKLFESNSAFSVSSPFDEIQFKNLAGETQNFYGKTKQVQYFDSALADTQLEQLTSWQSFRDMANGQLYTIE